MCAPWYGMGGAKAMRVDIVVVAVNQPELLGLLFKTAESESFNLRFRVFLHSRSRAVRDVCHEAQHDIRLYNYGTNRGVARSWNEGILDSYHENAAVVLVPNDDIWFSPGDIDKIAFSALNRRENYVIFCAGLNLRRGVRVPSHNWSCFALNPVALEKLGCFDENFFPVGGEDYDYVVRARRLGLEPYRVEDTSVFHAVVATRHSDELRAELERAMELNKAYFQRKWAVRWGGERTRKFFETPFDDPRFDMYIDPKVRHAPYSGYNRRTPRRGG
jgi:hypothetical protein